MCNIAQTVYNQIIKYNMISEGDKVLVALSGGADSVFLLNMMKILQEKIPFTIGAAHVNHLIRGDEATRDQVFCQKLCDTLCIKFHTQTINIPLVSKERKISEECAGREERYKYFESICQSYGYNKIAVAHNMNDSAETLVINLIRGCSLNGLGGIRPINGRIIRPILNIERSDIESYLKTNSISYCVDSTNSETIYTRNKIRNNILEDMKTINQSVVETIFSNLEILRDDNDFINQFCENTNAIIQSDNKVYVDKHILDQQHIAIKRRILYEAFRRLKGDAKDIEQKHIDILLGKYISGKIFNMPCSIVVRTEFDKIVFETENNSYDDFYYNVNTSSIVTLPNGIKYSFEVVSDILDFEKGVIYVDYNKINPEHLYIRSRKEGDKFIPQGMNGTKKLKQYFIEQKIPSDKRNEVPILCSDDEIVAVIPYRVSEKHKISDTTKQILRIQMIKEK